MMGHPPDRIWGGHWQGLVLCSRRRENGHVGLAPREREERQVTQSGGLSRSLFGPPRLCFFCLTVLRAGIPLTPPLHSEVLGRRGQGER